MRTKCRHYNSPIHNDCCAVGVNYRKLGDDSKAGYIVRLPCVVGSPLTKDPVVCEKIDLFTPDELKKIEQEMLDIMDAVAKAISVIKKSKQQFVCEKIDLFTPDELKKIEQEMSDRMDAVAKAISVIKKSKQQSGHVTCPTCSNKLHFSIAKSNGHIWGKCETDKCLSWME